MGYAWFGKIGRFCLIFVAVMVGLGVIFADENSHVGQESDLSLKYSVVIPMRNEQDNIIDLIEELEPIMMDFDASWELICINDDSTDATGMILTDLAKEKKYLHVISFLRNSGKSSALKAGFEIAKGEYVITMDGDMQDDPRDIEKLLTAVSDCDMVTGVRWNRQDTLFKRVISRIANSIRSRLCGDGIRDTGCGLKIMRTSCLRQIKMYDGMHRFFPALFIIEGFRIKQIEVNHRKRNKGSSKYNLFNRSWNTIEDLFAVMWMRKRHLDYVVDYEIPEC